MSKLKLVHKETGQVTTVTDHAYNLWDKKTKNAWKLANEPEGNKSLDKSKEGVPSKFEKAKANAKRLISEGSFDAAIEAYEKAKELNPNAAGWLTRQINAVIELRDAKPADNDKPNSKEDVENP